VSGEPVPVVAAVEGCLDKLVWMGGAERGPFGGMEVAARGSNGPARCC
jgi:hypothetical protein